MENSSQVSHGGNRLSIELGSALNLQFPNEESRHMFSLIGMDIDEILIVKPKAFPQVLHLIEEGVSVVVRYLSNGKVFGFRSRILGKVVKPLPMVFLSYPDRLETINLRQKERIYCYLPAQLLTAQATLPGMVVDLSEGGCRWVSKNPLLPKEIHLTINETIHIAFPLPGKCGVIHLQAMIRVVNQEPGLIQVGMAFQNMNAQAAEDIARYVAEAKSVQQKMA